MCRFILLTVILVAGESGFPAQSRDEARNKGFEQIQQEADPKNKMKLIDNMFSRWSASGFENVEPASVSKLAQIRSTTCSASAVDCSSQNSWVRFACTPAARTDADKMKIWLGRIDPVMNQKMASALISEIDRCYKISGAPFPELALLVLHKANQKNWSAQVQSSMNYLKKIEASEKLDGAGLDLIRDVVTQAETPQSQREGLASVLAHFLNRKKIDHELRDRVLSTVMYVDMFLLNNPQDVVGIFEQFSKEHDSMSTPNLQQLIELYCFAQRSSLKTEKCEAEIENLRKSRKDVAANWIDMQNLQIKLDELDLEGAAAILNQNGMGSAIAQTAVAPKEPWMLLQASRVYRRRGDVALASKYLELFLAKSRMNQAAETAYNLEKAHLERLQGHLESSTQLLKLAQTGNLKQVASVNSFLGVVINLDLYINAVLAGNKEIQASLAMQISQGLKGKANKKLFMLILDQAGKLRSETYPPAPLKHGDLAELNEIRQEYSKTK